MDNTPMTPEQEYEFYAKPENQEPQGPARRRRASRLGPRRIQARSEDEMERKLAAITLAAITRRAPSAPRPDPVSDSARHLQ